MKPGLIFRLPLAAGRICLAMALLSIASGCRSSNMIVLDNRPAWMAEAEQRLKQKPVANVNQSGADAERRPLWGKQAAADTAQTARNTSARISQKPPPAQTSAPAAQPPGISWGRTQITVQVED